MMKLLRKIKIKGKAQSGFTLVEMLMTVLILSMVSAVVAGGLPMAVSAYTNVVNTANAESLLSTAMTRLRDELGTASHVTPEENGVSYRRSDGSAAKICLGVLNENGDRTNEGESDDRGERTDDQPRMLIQEYIGIANLPEDLKNPRVFAEMSNENLYVNYSGLSYKDGILSFTGLVVEKDGNALTRPQDFKIRVLTDSIS